jgi:hypothetical protein
MIYIENTMVRAAKSKIYLGNMGLTALEERIVLEKSRAA